MRAQDPRDAHPRLRDLLEHERVRDGVDRDTPVSLGHQHPEQAHRLHLLDDLFGVAPGELPFASYGSDALAREVAHEISKRRLLLRELEVHGPA